MMIKEDDILRVEDLLSADQAGTEAAKIMNVEGSSAQRFKKIIQQTSDSQGDLNLKWELLGENAVTLQVPCRTMSHEDQLGVRHA